MFAAYSRNTEAGARRIAAQRGLSLPAPVVAPEQPSAPVGLREARQRIIETSRHWQMGQEPRQRPSHVLSEAIERAKRKHRRTRPYEPGNNGSRPQQIIAMVAAWHGVGADDIMGRSRTRQVVAARHDAMAAVYLNCRIAGQRYSLPALGRVFGGMDHTTALHALRKRGLK